MTSAFSARDVALAPLHPEGAVEQIVRRLGEAIGAGVLAPGERLPSELALAAQLGVAPMTLRQALQILREAGFVETRRGRTGGSFVREDPPAALVVAGDPPSRGGASPADGLATRGLGRGGRLSRRSAPTQSERLAIAGGRRHGRERGRRVRAVSGSPTRASTSASRRPRGSRRLVAAETQIQVEIAEMLRIVPGPRLARWVSQAGHDPIVAAILDGNADGGPRRDDAPR